MNEDQGRAAASSARSSMISTSVVLVAVLALGGGALAGWFGHEAQAKAKLRAETVPATAGSGAASGPCGAWEEKICAGGGSQSEACHQAKAATHLLTPSVCGVALETVPATLARVKASRASCDTLIAKLCGDLPEGSAACTMVKERTPGFPVERCEQMLKDYDRVIAELKKADEQGLRPPGPPHRPGPPGMPPGAMPPGMPPGAMPSGGSGAPPPQSKQ